MLITRTEKQYTVEGMESFAFLGAWYDKQRIGHFMVFYRDPSETGQGVAQEMQNNNQHPERAVLFYGGIMYSDVYDVGYVENVEKIGEQKYKVTVNVYADDYSSNKAYKGYIEIDARRLSDGVINATYFGDISYYFYGTDVKYALNHMG